ncbi:MAG: hypothetical protein AMJ56_17215 [Anaerolineae bacterium SG8_19]|nr:MAG: hypothetical protein AMJ56_17215 [Anaerolineae bacterium SG8_19]
MKQRSLFTVLLMFSIVVLAACNAVGAAEPVAETNSEKVSVGQCAEATEGTHQLIYAAEGICFLYPDNYDVFGGEDGSLTLYVGSLLNTEAPLATIHFDVLDGRSIQEVIPDYPSDAELATLSLLTLELGEETATVLDNMPGQDINRRIIAVHDDRVIDIMIARIGPEHGAVGEQAEALFNTITGSFQFIGIELHAPLLAGPECPKLVEDSTLYTNEVAGYCLLMPASYLVQEINPAAGENEMAFYMGTLQDVNHARLFIKVTYADGRSLEEVTAAHKAEIDGALPGSDVMWSFGYMLDGVPANQFDQVPGQDLSRHVVMVRDGRQYLLSFVPDDPGAGEAYDEMETVYKLVIDSFSFLRQS